MVSELTNVEDLVQQLRVTYEKVVAGEGSALIGAKGMVTTAVHFYRNRGQLSVPVCLIFLVGFISYVFEASSISCEQYTHVVCGRSNLSTN